MDFVVVVNMINQFGLLVNRRISGYGLFSTKVGFWDVARLIN